jgi:hypothetical protein
VIDMGVPSRHCLFYADPVQMILFINGLQWKATSAMASSSLARAPVPIPGPMR